VSNLCWDLYSCLNRYCTYLVVKSMFVTLRPVIFPRIVDLADQSIDQSINSWSCILIDNDVQNKRPRRNVVSIFSKMYPWVSKTIIFFVGPRWFPRICIDWTWWRSCRKNYSDEAELQSSFDQPSEVFQAAAQDPTQTCIFWSCNCPWSGILISRVLIVVVRVENVFLVAFSYIFFGFHEILFLN